MTLNSPVRTPLGELLRQGPGPAPQILNPREPLISLLTLTTSTSLLSLLLSSTPLSCSSFPLPKLFHDLVPGVTVSKPSASLSEINYRTRKSQRCRQLRTVNRARYQMASLSPPRNRRLRNHPGSCRCKIQQRLPSVKDKVPSPALSVISD